ncbi:AMP-binding protein [Streptomyces sp. DASNCL29]|nr:AMP-binding protein [Streptomyces sp. DASNCL29]
MANIGLTPRTPELVGRRRLGGAWKSETLVKRWQRVADAHPDREAVVAPDGRLSHAELPPASHRIAVGLLRQGLVPGNRVILQSGNSFGTILARYGPLKARAGTGEHASGSPTPRDRDDCAAGRGYGPPGPGTTRVRRGQVHRGDGRSGAQPTSAAHTRSEPRHGGDQDRGPHIRTCGPGAAGARVEYVQAVLHPNDIATLQLSASLRPTRPARRPGAQWDARSARRTTSWSSRRAPRPRSSEVGELCVRGPLSTSG